MKLWQELKSNKIVVLLTETINSFDVDNGSLLAAAVAYNLLFSLFPFALAVISIAGFIIESPVIEEQIINALGNLIPVARGMITSTLHGVIDARTTTGIIALLGLIWSACSFFSAIRKSLNTAWGLKTRMSYFKGEIIDIVMMIGAFIALIVYIWLSTTVRIIHTANFHSDVFVFLNSNALSATIFTFFSALLAFVVILLLYRFIPSERPRWKDIWLGALLAAISFEIVRFVFIWYLKNFSHYNLVYGSIGTVIALLMFIYLAAWALLFFAKLSVVNMHLKAGQH